LHSTEFIGQPKVASAISRLKSLNANIVVTGSQSKLNFENAISHLNDFDIVIDATDNVESRYIINDACILLGKICISGSAIGLDGQIFVIYPREGPCYRCLYPQISTIDACRRFAKIISC